MSIATASRAMWVRARADLGDFVSWLRRPRYTGFETRSRATTAWRLLSWYAVIMVAVLATAAMAEAFGVKKAWIGPDVLEPRNGAQWVSAVLQLVVLAPVFEEIAFRGWLLRAREAFGSAILVVPLGAVAALAWVGFSGLTSALVGLSLAAAMFLWQTTEAARPMRTRRLTRALRRILPITVFASSTGFAVVHLANYASSGMPGQASAMLVVAPQWVMGLAFAWVRVRFGLRWSMAMHAFHNFVVGVLPATIYWMVPAWRSSMG